MPPKTVLDEFKTALQEEISEVKKKGQASFVLSDGYRVLSKGSGLWYCFFAENMPQLPADTPCRLIVGKEKYDVTVISSDENKIIISTETELPDEIEKAKLENGSTILMERLIGCIEKNKEKDNPAGNRLFPDENGAIYQAKRLFSYNHIEYY